MASEKIIDKILQNAEEEKKKIIADGHNYIFVGRVGQFCPIKPG